jgi:hypothetical protein
MEPKSTARDLEHIRLLMDRSVKFVSLSGLSGVLAGIYALLGAAYAYSQLYTGAAARSVTYIDGRIPVVADLLVAAALVLIASLATGWWFSFQKAKHAGVSLWTSTTRRLLANLLVPLAAGGFFTLILLSQQQYQLVASAVLLFYGLALMNASGHLFEEIRYLAMLEIILGLVAAFFPANGLVFWSLGFGVLHIVYGLVMYKKYDR